MNYEVKLTRHGQQKCTILFKEREEKLYDTRWLTEISKRWKKQYIKSNISIPK